MLTLPLHAPEGSAGSPAPLQEAITAQAQASHPEASSFVSASAGSGKTKLLTDRLLRLMLSGAPPGGIHCLTYTKAAAAEMQIRLQTILGTWVTAPDAELDSALETLEIPPTAASRRLARSLFGRVLDLPGGMRIGTIHSFCQSLLRRFPLEARLSPHFELADDTESARLLNEALEDTLAAPDVQEQRAIETLAGLCRLDGIRALIRCLFETEPSWSEIAPLQSNTYVQRLADYFGVTAPTRADLLREATRFTHEPHIRAHLAVIALRSGTRGQAFARACLDWLDNQDRESCWHLWVTLWIKQDGGKRDLPYLFTKSFCAAEAALVEACEGEQERILAIVDQLAALEMTEASRHLFTLAKTVHLRLQDRKSRTGLLDYNDLIAHTRALLKSQGAAWVRYKLDQGIDHLLLDEAQDTSAAQWDIAQLLWEEFYAGAGAREKPRTVFVVGDFKQSIYSFQGADPQAFLQARERLENQVAASALRFASPQLNVSFRSTAPVLALVDAVFRDPASTKGVGGPSPAGWPTHRPVREGQAGRVELWPLTPMPDSSTGSAWSTPKSYQTQISAKQRLADALAEWIRNQTGGATLLESRGRPLRPGDVLVLVRKRDDFVRALEGALKKCGVPVAGLDRMVLTDEPAVQDLLSLCETLLLPEDDLSLAEFLVSPLGGLTDASLMRLAIDRGQAGLFETLQARAAEQPDWQSALEFLTRLRARVDYAPPHALLAEALGPLGGRARLLERLGPEASEPIDELLAAALRHASLHPPSLQSFLHWLGDAGGDIKREPETAHGAGMVRIMTVHGAKGLEAPLVIIPDIAGRQNTRPRLIFPTDGPPFWLIGARCRRAEEARQAADLRCEEEENRLLYVALTRAQDRLLICGTQRKRGEALWHGAAARGFACLPAQAAPFAAVQNPWAGEVLTYAVPQTAAAKPDADPTRPTPTPIPPWAGAAPGWRAAPPPPEPILPQPLAPSRPENADLGPAPPAGSPREPSHRFARGKLIHLLLQHLPDLPPEARQAAALRAARIAPGVDPADAPAIAAEMIGLLAHPDLAPLFGPASRAEVPLSGLLGTRIVQGVVDRLAVLPDRVIIADYKSNRRKPARVPVLYLRQMATYRALILKIFPDREVDCRLIWTQDGSISHLSGAELAGHAPS